MPRYFFHQIIKGSTVLDLEGTDLPDLEHARTEALQDARHLMAEAIREGRDISTRSIQVCDERGTLLLVMAFADATKPED